MIRVWTVFASSFFLVSIAPVLADSISFDGELHKDVYVTEASSFYVVSFPATGESKTVSKSKVAPDSVQLSDDATRTALYEQWRESRGLGERTDVVATPMHDEPEPEADPRSKLEQFKYHQAMLTVAEFEAGLEHWAGLSPEIRSAITGGVVASHGSRREFFNDRISGKRATRSANNSAISTNSARIGELSSEIARHNREEARAVDSAYSDPSLEFYGQMYESTYFRREAQLRNGYYNPYTDISVDYYYSRYDNELAKAGSRAAAANSRHSAARSSLSRTIQSNQQAIRDLNERNRQLRHQEQNNAIFRAQEDFRTQSKLALYRSYEDAIASEYVPYLKRQQIASMYSGDDRPEVSVTIDSDVWRLDFQCYGSTGFYIDVFEADRNKPVTRLDENTAPHERYRVFDEAGKFRIAVSAPADSAYEVHVYEISD